MTRLWQAGIVHLLSVVLLLSAATPVLAQGGSEFPRQISLIGFTGTVPVIDATGKVLTPGKITTLDGAATLEIPIGTTAAWP